jgi:hypothetical protein
MKGTPGPKPETRPEPLTRTTGNLLLASLTFTCQAAQPAIISRLKIHYKISNDFFWDCLIRFPKRSAAHPACPARSRQLARQTAHSISQLFLEMNHLPLREALLRKEFLHAGFVHAHQREYRANAVIFGGGAEMVHQLMRYSPVPVRRMYSNDLYPRDRSRQPELQLSRSSKYETNHTIVQLAHQ